MLPLLPRASGPCGRLCERCTARWVLHRGQCVAEVLSRDAALSTDGVPSCVTTLSVSVPPAWPAVERGPAGAPVAAPASRPPGEPPHRRRSPSLTAHWRRPPRCPRPSRPRSRPWECLPRWSGSWPSKASTHRSPSSPGRFPKPSAAVTCWARPRPDPARRWPSACPPWPGWPASARAGRAGSAWARPAGPGGARRRPAAWCSSRPASSPSRSLRSWNPWAVPSTSR